MQEIEFEFDENDLFVPVREQARTGNPNAIDIVDYFNYRTAKSSIFKLFKIDEEVTECSAFELYCKLSGKSSKEAKEHWLHKMLVDGITVQAYNDSLPNAIAIDTKKKIYSFNEFINSYPNQDFIIEDLIAKKSIGMIYGASGSGKTFVVIDMIMNLARGTSFAEQKTQQTGIVCVLGEDASGVKSRLLAYVKEHNITEDLPIFFVPKSINFSKKDSERNDIEYHLDKIQEHTNIGLIVIDTVATCFVGDENNALAVNSFLHDVKDFAANHKCAMLLVHHTGKDSAKGARGSSAFRSAMDYELEVSNENNTITVKHTKAKSCTPIESIKFRLVTRKTGLVNKFYMPILAATLERIYE